MKIPGLKHEKMAKTYINIYIVLGIAFLVKFHLTSLRDSAGAFHARVKVRSSDFSTELT